MSNDWITNPGYSEIPGNIYHEDGMFGNFKKAHTPNTHNNETISDEDAEKLIAQKNIRFKCITFLIVGMVILTFLH